MINKILSKIVLQQFNYCPTKYFIKSINAYANYIRIDKPFSNTYLCLEFSCFCLICCCFYFSESQLPNLCSAFFSALCIFDDSSMTFLIENIFDKLILIIEFQSKMARIPRILCCDARVSFS